jgi:hypothetical protein
MICTHQMQSGGSNRQERECKKRHIIEYRKQNFARKYDEKRLTGRPWRGWADDIKMDLKQTDCQLDSSCSGRDSVFDSDEHSHEPLGPLIEP